MGRRLPWQDYVAYAVIPTLLTAVSVVAAFTPQEWTALMLVFCIGVPVVAWVTYALILLQLLNQLPDCETVFGISAWTHGNADVCGQLSEAASFYVDCVLASDLVDCTMADLYVLLRRVRVDVVSGAFYHTFYGKDKKLSGLQMGTYIKIAWFEGFHTNAFFHEMHHVVDECIRNVYDPEHKDSKWWDLIPDMKKAWERRLYS